MESPAQDFRGSLSGSEGGVEVEISSHPSVNELRQVIQARGGNIVCNVCGREEFSMEQIAPMDAAGSGYGTHRLQRVHLVCDNCGHVMAFELGRLR